MVSKLHQAAIGVKERLYDGPLDRLNGRQRARQIGKTQAAIALASNDPEAARQIQINNLHSVVSAELGEEMTRVKAEGDTVVHLARLVTKTAIDNSITTSDGPMRRPGVVPRTSANDMSPLTGRTISDKLLMRFPKIVDGRLGVATIGLPFDAVVINTQDVLDSGVVAGSVGTVVPLFKADFGEGEIRDPDSGLKATHVSISSRALHPPRHTDFGEIPTGLIEVRTDNAISKGAGVIFYPYNVSNERIDIPAQNVSNGSSPVPSPSDADNQPQEPEQFVYAPVVRRLGQVLTAAQVLGSSVDLPLLSAAVERTINSPVPLTAAVELFVEPFVVSGMSGVSDRNGTYRQLPPEIRIINPTQIG